MTDMNKLASANARRFAAATVTRNVASVARALVAAKARYQTVEKKTGVPWFIVAVIHMRESSQSWKRSLAQGDPIDEVSTHVPKGRGPFKTWEDAAIDALVECAPFLARKKDWSLGPALANLEAYNGLGYASRGVPSPYLWAGTSEYKAGKYVADGKYDPNHVDQQPGCATLIKAMMAIDPTITFTGATIAPAPAVKPAAKSAAPKVIAGGVVTTVGVGVQQGWGATQWVIASVVIAAVVLGAVGLAKGWFKRS
ncbi:hypothetical protein [Bradyrhizobium cenepequi]